MIRVALRGLAARPVRTALTTLAIVVGVAFVCAAYPLTDTMSGAAGSLTHAAYVALAAGVVAWLGKYGLSYAVPAPSLVAVALIAALAGVLAAALPARRAARIDVLKALAYE